MSLYSIIGHALLRCGRISSAVLEAQAQVAEDLLGFTDLPLYTGDKFIRATNAVVLRVNYQLAQPRNPYLKSQTRGARAETYSAEFASAWLAEAEAIAAALLEETAAASTEGDYAAITSYR